MDQVPLTSEDFALRLNPLWKQRIFGLLRSTYPVGTKILAEKVAFEFELPGGETVEYTPSFSVEFMGKEYYYEVAGYLSLQDRKKLMVFRAALPELLPRLVVVSHPSNRDWVTRALGCVFWDYYAMTNSLQ